MCARHDGCSTSDHEPRDGNIRICGASLSNQRQGRDAGAMEPPPSGTTHEVHAPRTVLDVGRVRLAHRGNAVTDHPATPPTGGLTVEEIQWFRKEHADATGLWPKVADAAEAYLRLRGELERMISNLRAAAYAMKDSSAIVSRTLSNRADELDAMLAATVATPMKETP